MILNWTLGFLLNEKRQGSFLLFKLSMWESLNSMVLIGG